MHQRKTPKIPFQTSKGHRKNIERFKKEFGGIAEKKDPIQKRIDSNMLAMFYEKKPRRL